MLNQKYGRGLSPVALTSCGAGELALRLWEYSMALNVCPRPTPILVILLVGAPTARVQLRAARAPGVTRAGARGARQAAEGSAGLRGAFRAREARLLLLLGCMRSPLLPSGGPASGPAALTLVRLHWCGVAP